MMRRQQPSRFGLNRTNQSPVWSLPGDDEKMARDQKRLQQQHDQAGLEGLGGTVVLQTSRLGGHRYIRTVEYSQEELERMAVKYKTLVEQLMQAISQSWDRSRRTAEGDEHWSPSSRNQPPQDLNGTRQRLSKLHWTFSKRLFEATKTEAGGQTTSLLTDQDLQRGEWCLLLSYLTGLDLPTLIELVKSFVFYQPEDGRILEMIVRPIGKDDEGLVLNEDGSGLFALVELFQDSPTLQRQEEAEKRPSKRRRISNSGQSSSSAFETKYPRPLPLSLMMLFVHLVDRELFATDPRNPGNLETRLSDIRSKDQSKFSYEEALRLYKLERLMLNPEHSPLTIPEALQTIASNNYSAFDEVCKASGLPYPVVYSRIVEMIFLRNELEGSTESAWDLVQNKGSFYSARRCEMAGDAANGSGKKRANKSNSSPILISESLQAILLDPMYPLLTGLDVKLALPHQIDGCILFARDLEARNDKFSVDQCNQAIYRLFYSYLRKNQLFDLGCVRYIHSNPLHKFVTQSSFHAVKLFCQQCQDLSTYAESHKADLQQDELAFLQSACENTLCWLLKHKFPEAEAYYYYRELTNNSLERYTLISKDHRQAPPRERVPESCTLITNADGREIVDYMPLLRRVKLFDEDVEPESAPMPKRLTVAPLQMITPRPPRTPRVEHLQAHEKEEERSEEEVSNEATESVDADESEKKKGNQDADEVVAEAVAVGENIESEKETGEQDADEVVAEADVVGENVESNEADSRGDQLEEDAEPREDISDDMGAQGKNDLVEIDDEEEEEGENEPNVEVVRQLDADEHESEVQSEPDEEKEDEVEQVEARARTSDESVGDGEEEDTMLVERQQEEDVEPQPDTTDVEMADVDDESTGSPPAPAAKGSESSSTSTDDRSETEIYDEAKQEDASSAESESETKQRPDVEAHSGGESDEFDAGRERDEQRYQASSEEEEGKAQDFDDSRSSAGTPPPPPPPPEERDMASSEKAGSVGSVEVIEIPDSPDKAGPVSAADESAAEPKTNEDVTSDDEDDLPAQPEAASSPQIDPDAASIDRAIGEASSDEKRDTTMEDVELAPTPQENASPTTAGAMEDEAIAPGDDGYEAEDDHPRHNDASAKGPSYDSASQEEVSSQAADADVAKAQPMGTERDGVGDSSDALAEERQEQEGAAPTKSDSQDPGYYATAEDSQHSEEEEEEKETTKGGASEPVVAVEEAKSLSPPPQERKTDPEPGDGYLAAEESQEEEERLKERVEKPQPMERDGYDAEESQGLAEEDSQANTEEDDIPTPHQDHSTIQQPDNREKDERHVEFSVLDPGYLPEGANTEDERPVPRTDGYQGGESSICQTEDEAEIEDTASKRQDEEDLRDDLAKMDEEPIPKPGSQSDNQDAGYEATAEDESQHSEEPDEQTTTGRHDEEDSEIEEYKDKESRDIPQIKAMDRGSLGAYAAKSQELHPSNDVAEVGRQRERPLASAVRGDRSMSQPEEERISSARPEDNQTQPHHEENEEATVEPKGSDESPPRMSPSRFMSDGKSATPSRFCSPKEMQTKDITFTEADDDDEEPPDASAAEEKVAPTGKITFEEPEEDDDDVEMRSAGPTYSNEEAHADEGQDRKQDSIDTDVHAEPAPDGTSVDEKEHEQAPTLDDAQELDAQDEPVPMEVEPESGAQKSPQDNSVEDEQPTAQINADEEQQSQANSMEVDSGTAEAGEARDAGTTEAKESSSVIHDGSKADRGLGAKIQDEQTEGEDHTVETTDKQNDSAPDKAPKRGRWSKDEKTLYQEAVEQQLEQQGKDFRHINWEAVSEKVGTRSTQQCKARGQQYFHEVEEKRISEEAQGSSKKERAEVDHPQSADDSSVTSTGKGRWTEEENALLEDGRNQFGSEYEKIAELVKTRTAEQVKTRINYLEKKGKARKPLDEDLGPIPEDDEGDTKLPSRSSATTPATRRKTRRSQSDDEDSTVPRRRTRSSAAGLSEDETTPRKAEASEGESDLDSDSKSASVRRSSRVKTKSHSDQEDSTVGSRTRKRSSIGLSEDKPTPKKAPSKGKRTSLKTSAVKPKEQSDEDSGAEESVASTQRSRKPSTANVASEKRKGSRTPAAKAKAADSNDETSGGEGSVASSKRSRKSSASTPSSRRSTRSQTSVRRTTRSSVKK